MEGKYAQVNGLKMYYEVHGTGKPLLLLHGAFGTLEGWETVLPTLSKDRQVIMVELQGHGHTADIDRPLTPTGMADDVAALLKELKLQHVDTFGYSMGGEVGLALAIRHPEAVGKLAILGSTLGSMEATYEKEMYDQFLSLDPETFNFPQLKDPYTKVAPDPSKWPVLVRKISEMGKSYKGYSSEEAKAIQSPVLIMMGDREGIRLEHAVEMKQAIPNSQLAIFPGGDHFVLFMHPERVLGALVPFLESETG